MKALLTTVSCALALGLISPVGAIATAPSSQASASKTPCQSRDCKLNAQPTAQAPWKFSDTKIPLTASYDGKKLKVISKVKGACTDSDLNVERLTYPVNVAVPVSKGAFDFDTTVTGSNGKPQILLLRGTVAKNSLTITISASFKDASSCVIGGNRNAVPRKL